MEASPQTYPSTSGSSARVLTILGFVFAAVALIFLPIVFGPAAIVCAAIGMSKGDPLGKWALAAAIAGMLIGFVLGYIVYRETSEDAQALAMLMVRR